MKLNPIVREDFAFLRRRAWALAPLWLLAAAISWGLPDEKFHASLVWCNLGIVVGLVTAPTTGPRRGVVIYSTCLVAFLLTHVVRWHFFGW